MSLPSKQKGKGILYRTKSIHHILILDEKAGTKIGLKVRV